MKELILNDGNTIPMVGLGTYELMGQEGVAAIITALSNGYRLFDTASFYKNEDVVGKGIKESGIARDEIFVTTKIWREYLGYERTKREFEKSLKKLNLNYVDLLLIHWPANAKNYDDWQYTNATTWQAMEELKAEGKIKSIGVSNFWQEHLDALLLTANIIPAINQIEFHPGYWQADLVKYCQHKNIAVESWSPFARGTVFNNEIFKKIATTHNKSTAQVCLKWIIQHNVIVIPKSATKSRMIENINLFDFELSDKEMKQIDELPEMGFSGEMPNIWPDEV